MLKSYSTSSTFFNFWNMYHGEFPKFKSGTRKGILLKKDLLKWKMERGNVHIYYTLNHQLRDLFFHSFHFLVFWLLVFEICIVLSEHPTCHLRCAWQKKKKEKPFNCSWWPEQNSRGRQSSLLKRSCQKIGKEIKVHIYHFCLYSCPVLQCTTKAYLVCSIT